MNLSSGGKQLPQNDTIYPPESSADVRGQFQRLWTEDETGLRIGKGIERILKERVVTRRERRSRLNAQNQDALTQLYTLLQLINPLVVWPASFRITKTLGSRSRQLLVLLKGGGTSVCSSLNFTVSWTPLKCIGDMGRLVTARFRSLLSRRLKRGYP